MSAHPVISTLRLEIISKAYDRLCGALGYNPFSAVTEEILSLPMKASLVQE